MNDYPAHLAAMWQKAIAPRKPDAPTVISLFAGGGGSLTGYLMAGYRDLLAVEWDDNAVATLRANYPDLTIYHGDIAQLSVDEALRLSGVRPGELDILDGSPPCQGFSTAGKRLIDDPRNQLFREYVRLLRGLRPRVFVMENVSGMVKGKMKLIFVDILRELKSSGYRVSAKLLNAMYFHVPQSRERMIFIGVRDDLGIEPTHPAGEGRPVTVGEAMTGIQLTDEDRRQTALTPLYQKYWHAAGQWGVVGRMNQNMRIAESRPSKTLQHAEGNGGVYHPTECRALCRHELARIGSFPDEYLFAGHRRYAKERIGNSVPPLMAEAIARHIRTQILSHVRQ